MFHKRSSAINLIYSGQQLFSYTAVIYNNELEQKKFYDIVHSSDNGAARSLGKIEVGHFSFLAPRVLVKKHFAYRHLAHNALS